MPIKPPSTPRLDDAARSLTGGQTDYRKVYKDLESASRQLSGQFSGVAGGGLQALENSAIATSSILSGNFSTALGKGALVLGGLTVATTAAIATAKGFANSALGEGAKALNQPFSILTGTIGTMLVPGFVLAGTVALGMAESLAGNAETISTWWSKWAAPAETFGKNVKDAAVAAWEFTNNIGNKAKSTYSAYQKLPDAVSVLMAKAGEKIGWVPEGTANAVEDDARKKWGMKPTTPQAGDNGSIGDDFGDEGANGQNAPAVSEGFLKNFQKITNAIKEGAFAGRVGTSSVEEARSRIQEQNMQSELQRQQLEITKETVKVLEGISDKIGRRQGMAP